MKNLIRDAYLFAAIFCIYALGRAAIFFIFPHADAVPTAKWLWLCARFDLMTAAYILLPTAVLTMVSLASGREFAAAKKLYANAAIFISTCLAVVNVCFFSEYEAQFNHWIFGIFVDDFGAIMGTIKKDYPVAAILACMLAYAVAVRFLTKFIFAKTERFSCKISKARAAAASVAYVFLLVVLMRGGSLRGRPLQLRDTAITPSAFLNNLAPSSAYCIKTELLAYISSTTVGGLKNFGAKEREMPEFAESLFGAKAANIDEHLSYKAGGALLKNRPKRIFLIVGESNSAWPLLFNLPEYDVSPRQKQISQNALYSDTALPAAYGTMTTVSSIISGLPATGLSVKGVFKSATDYAFAGFMKRLGYSGTFFYAGQSTWLQLGEFALFNKFDKVVGGENMGSLYGSVEWGLRDKDMFNFIAASDIPENTFNMILTVSNHPPFDVDLKAEGCPHKPKDETDNKIWHHWYADNCIGDFVEKIRAKYPDSLIVITGDHPSRMIAPQLKSETLATKTVPIIFAGAPAEPLKKRLNFITHLDIMPTIVEMIAPKGFEYKTWGAPAFAAKRRLPPMNTEAVVADGKLYPVNSSACPPELKEMHRKFLALAYYRSVSDGSLKEKAK